ncbi:MAG: hypothetical protein JWL93_933 [Hyphomicrobiales bacterium]|jgi:uroporphyrinogen-III synthase|nr:hypothetical protein [Hyphomicrobiales bacterium]
MRLLLTRPLRDSQRSAARLRALGHEVLVAPVLNIVPTRETCPEQPADAVLATSSHAFDDADRLPFALHDLPLHIVGERTGYAAVTAGFRTPETVAPDAEALVRALSATIPSGTRYLYLAGRDRSPRLETALIASGNAVVPWVIYEAAPVETLDAAALDALAALRIDAVLHFSPRSAALFVDLATKAGRLPQAMAALQVAISPRAAEPLLAHASRVRIAATPDLDGMIATLA